MTSCLMHGSETWPMKVEHELKVNRTEMTTIRMDVWCSVDWKKEKWKTPRMGTSQFDKNTKSRLIYFGYEHKDDNDWVKRWTTWEVGRN